MGWGRVEGGGVKLGLGGPQKRDCQWNASFDPFPFVFPLISASPDSNTNSPINKSYPTSLHIIITILTILFSQFFRLLLLAS